GTRPEYRGRGLVRTQFEVLHEWSARRGELLQVIAGVPWFYRQFGYEMALPRGGGPRFARTDVPPPAPGTPLPFRVRPMRADDLPFVVGLDDRSRERGLVSVPRDERLWALRAGGPYTGQRHAGRAADARAREARPAGRAADARERERRARGIHRAHSRALGGIGGAHTLRDPARPLLARALA